MSKGMTREQIIARLDENDLDYATLPLQDGASLVISRRGGRIFGPFLSDEGESALWVNEAFGQADAFADFLASGAWNLGGSRIWIAPEIQYGVRDRQAFEETLFWPEQVDPGTYELTRPKADRVQLAQDMTLRAYNLASGEKELRLDRLIRPADNPLRNTSDFQATMAGVTYAGYQQTVTLSESKSDEVMSEAWCLTQLNPGGELIIPASPAVEFVDYLDPVGSLQTLGANHVRLQITGDRQYKVGYKAAHVFGRLGYVGHLDDGRAFLLVRTFFNDPSLPYVEEPAHLPGHRGQSIHVYNDDGNLGGFGEMECNGRTIGGKTGRRSSTDAFALWFYAGTEKAVKGIALQLLGVEI